MQQNQQLTLCIVIFYKLKCMAGGQDKLTRVGA